MIDCDFSNVLFWTSRPLLAQYSLIWFLLLSWISIWLIMTTLIPFPSSRWALKTHLLNIFYIHSRDVNDFLRAAAPFGGELLYGSKRHSFYLKNTKRPNQLLFIQNFQWKTVVWSSDSSPKQRHEGSPLWDRHKWTLGRNGKYILNLFLGIEFLTSCYVIYSVPGKRFCQHLPSLWWPRWKHHYVSNSTLRWLAGLIDFSG